VRGLKYTQVFKNNLDIIEKPHITKCKTKPYTKITFKPDYNRLGINGLTPDIIALLKKRVYDIGAVTDKSIKVKYNSQYIPVKSFQQYIDLYIGSEKRVYEEANERWEFAVALSPSHEFNQISFVNGIYTAKGGKHVEYILGQITRKLSDFIEKKKKVKVNANSIKEQLILFLRCDIENPAFDSQTKDFMNTPSSKFGSKCEVSDKFIEKVAKMGVMDAALQLTEIKDNPMNEDSILDLYKKEGDKIFKYIITFQSLLDEILSESYSGSDIDLLWISQLFNLNIVILDKRLKKNNETYKLIRSKNYKSDYFILLYRSIVFESNVYNIIQSKNKLLFKYNELPYKFINMILANNNK
jgi:hypothetical protein